MSASVHAGIHPPPQSRHLPGADTPYAVHAGRYGQQAGGTHAGMHTCFQFIYIVSYTKMLTKPTFCISKKKQRMVGVTRHIVFEHFCLLHVYKTKPRMMCDKYHYFIISTGVALLSIWF